MILFYLALIPGLSLVGLFGVNVLTLLNFPIWALSLMDTSVETVFSPTVVSLGLLMMTNMILACCVSVNYLNNNFQMVKISLMLGVIVLICFSAKNLLNFFIAFEVSILPMLLLIMGMGHQPERLTASKSMLLYTIAASLPLLGVILFLDFLVGSLDFWLCSTMNLSKTSGVSEWLGLFCVLSFLVKLPMFITHAWLPKAHVEAPTAGSMILAAIMLKLGGLGLINMSPFVLGSKIGLNVFSPWASLSMMLVGMMCMVMTDIKLVIAYSSVAHMSAVVYSVFTCSSLGLWAALTMILSHSFSSSGMFLLNHVVFLKTKSRLFFLNKNFLSFYPHVSIFSFIICLGNMGGPLTMNLWSEVMNLSLSLSWNFSSTITWMAGLFFSVAFTVIIYSSVNQGGLSFSSSFSSPVFMGLIANLLMHSLMIFLTMFIYSTLFFQGSFMANRC